jgi:hypothetical protein
MLKSKITVSCLALKGGVIHLCPDNIQYEYRNQDTAYPKSFRGCNLSFKMNPGIVP